MKNWQEDGDIAMRHTSANKNSFITMKGVPSVIFVWPDGRSRFCFRSSCRSQLCDWVGQNLNGKRGNKGSDIAPRHTSANKNCFITMKGRRHAHFCRKSRPVAIFFSRRTVENPLYRAGFPKFRRFTHRMKWEKWSFSWNDFFQVFLSRKLTVIDVNWR